MKIYERQYVLINPDNRQERILAWNGTWDEYIDGLLNNIKQQCKGGSLPKQAQIYNEKYTDKEFEGNFWFEKFQTIIVHKAKALSNEEYLCIKDEIQGIEYEV